jgi:glycogen(starch) synthase
MPALREEVAIELTQQFVRHGGKQRRPTTSFHPANQLRSTTVRVAMITWEYPPLVVGGIAAHADGLARALARAGHEVVVLTLSDHSAPDDHVIDGVRVLRAHADLPWIPDDQLVTRMASANHQVVQLAALLGTWRPDVVHAHDWLVAWAGDTLKAIWDVPLVATIHATERGRHGGHLPPGQPAVINAVEWWLTYQARELICCSEFMQREVIDGFELPHEKVHLVPNGVDLATWEPPVPAPDREPLVLAWGRVQYEKGFQVLIAAMSAVRQRVPNARCVIAGRGSYLPELQMQVDLEGAGEFVHLAGFVSDDALKEMLHRASCVVIPSLYEPFGIVALEALAAGAPTVVARTGGLAEIIEGTGAGLLVEPGGAREMADTVVRVLSDPSVAKDLQSNATQLLAARYSWDAIAVSTCGVYELATDGDE